MSVLRAKKAIVEKAPPKINLSEARLECYGYPRNCQAMVLAEFAGGHRVKNWPKRELSWRHWQYVLHHSIFAPYGRVGGMGKGSANIVNFSELETQSRLNFSGANLFKSAMEQEGVTGSKHSDHRYTFYTLNIPEPLWEKLRDPTVAGAVPKDANGIPPVSLSSQWT